MVLEYGLLFTVKHVPCSKLLALPSKTTILGHFFRIDAGAGKLLGMEEQNQWHFTGKCADFDSICAIDFQLSFQGVIA